MQQMECNSEVYTQSYDCFSTTYSACPFLLFWPDVDKEACSCMLVPIFIEIFQYQNAQFSFN